ncbi:MAG: hypothetical protein HYR63_23640 [Proteobacteria bacterium]|nr:hypothetical protein [Pseudomonadota bacterium]
MNPPRSRPLLDPSIIRRPGQAAPVAAPSYAPVETKTETFARPPSAPAPIMEQPATEPRPVDSMPWLGGRPWSRKLGIRVDEGRVRRIKIAAATRGTTMEEILVEAIDEYMERHWPEVSRGIK